MLFESKELPGHPYRSLGLVCFATFMAVTALSLSIYFSFQRLLTFESYIGPLNQVRAELLVDDTLLTDAVTRFARTGNREWERRYLAFAVAGKQRLDIIQDLARRSNGEIKVQLANVLDTADRLFALESIAIIAVKSGRLQKAADIIQGSEYLGQKQRLAESMLSLNREIKNDIETVKQEEKRIMLYSLSIAGFIALLVLPATWLFCIRQLRKWQALITKNTMRIMQGEQQLKDSNDTLNSLLHTAKSQRAEIVLLGEMGNMLHSCITSDEALKVLETYCLRLFPLSSGSFYLLCEEQGILKAMVKWGGASSEPDLFPVSDCLAMRRGTPHIAGPGKLISCSHVGTSNGHAPDYICIPLLAQTTQVGLFYLDVPQTEPFAEDSQPKLFFDLANAVAEHASLALANIQLRNKLREQSVCDQLTGLYNRRYLDETLNREMIRAGRKSATLGVIVLDIDHFKRYNDTFGHDAGDRVLTEIGHLLSVMFRGSDVACRLGGEEFVVVLLEATLSATAERAEDIRSAVAALHVEYAGQSLERVTISAGVAAFPCDGRSPATLLKAADAALYRAKGNGRDQVETAGAPVLAMQG